MMLEVIIIHHKLAALFARMEKKIYARASPPVVVQTGYNANVCMTQEKNGSGE